MTTDLDLRLSAALKDAAETTTISEDAFTSIIARADSPTRRRPVLWAVAGLAVSAVVVGIVIVARSNQDSAPTNLATIVLPGFGTAGGCGNVGQRPATADETAAVSYLPASLPDGYHSSGESSPAAIVQERRRSDVECWSADATYVDASGPRILTVTVSRQGDDVRRGCELPPGYLPSECTTVNAQPAGLTHEGTRATVGWVSTDGDLVSVSGFGFTSDELVAIAETAAFDGTHASLAPPSGMTQIEDTIKSRSDGRDVTYYNAAFIPDAGSADATPLTLTVTTWNDPSVNELGPAKVVDVDGLPAVVVTTGGPGTGIIGWTRPADATGSYDAVESSTAARAYITWNNDGVTFRVDGPDAQTVIQLAQALRHTG
jgi:hypothetical protein